MFSKASRTQANHSSSLHVQLTAPYGGSDCCEPTVHHSHQVSHGFRHHDDWLLIPRNVMYPLRILSSESVFGWNATRKILPQPAWWNCTITHLHLNMDVGHLPSENGSSWAHIRSPCEYATIWYNTKSTFSTEDDLTHTTSLRSGAICVPRGSIAWWVTLGSFSLYMITTHLCYLEDSSWTPELLPEALWLCRLYILCICHSR